MTKVPRSQSVGHRRHVAVFFTTLLSLALLCALGQAQAGRKDVPQLDMRGMAGKVIITPEPRKDIDVRVHYANRKVPTLMVSKRGNTTILDGSISHIDRVSGEDVHIAGVGRLNEAELPTVLIRVPMNVVIRDASHVQGVVGPSETLEVIYSGTGRWHFEPVERDASLIATGSGGLHLVSAATVQLDSSGSGMVILGKVGPLRAFLNGTGRLVVESSRETHLQNSGAADMIVGSTGSVEVRQFGSGRLNLSQVNGSFTLNSFGSGDVQVRNLNGPAQLFLSGSGNVTIADGNAPSFILKGTGNGDVYFGGTAAEVTVNTFGSGNIHIKTTTGKVVSKVRGSGRVDIGQNGQRP